MKKLLLLGISLLFLAFYGNAQTRPPRPFKYIKRYKNKDGGLTKIEFRDSIQNSVIKTLVLHDINPYFFPGEEVIDSTDEKTPVYKIPSTKTTLNGVSLLSEKYPGKYDPKTDFTVWSNYQISNNSQDFVVILIRISYMQVLSSNQIVSKTSLYVYNRKGVIVGKMEHIDNDLEAPEISSDGRYVSCIHGGECGEGRYSNVPTGDLIIDLEHQKIVYSKNNNSNGCYMVGKYFLHRERRTLEMFELTIIDLDKGYEYIKEVSYALDVVSITEDKIILNNNSTGKTVVMSLKDFNSQKINTNE